MRDYNRLAEPVAASGIIPVISSVPANKGPKLTNQLMNVPVPNANISSVPDTIGCLAFKQNNMSLVIDRMNKFGEKANSLREHVRLGPKISETVKGKLSLGARILQLGGVNKIFRRIFKCAYGDGEVLLKASQCYLSTTAGPIAGLLFITTHRVAFCSERSVKFSGPNSGEIIRHRYKVSIPLRKIQSTSQNCWGKYLKDDFGAQSKIFKILSATTTFFFPFLLNVCFLLPIYIAFSATFIPITKHHSHKILDQVFG